MATKLPPKLKIVEIEYDNPPDGETHILCAVQKEGEKGTTELYLPLAPVSAHKLEKILAQLRGREFEPMRVPLDLLASEPIASYEMLWPYDAILALAKNKNNRTLRLERVESYAHSIHSDDWDPTCQGIGYDTNGDMIDGQHRSWGIIFANKPAKLLVCRGLNPNVKTKVDTGAVRSLACLLELDPEGLNLKELPSPKIMTAILFRIFALGGGQKNLWNASKHNLTVMIQKYKKSLKWLEANGYCSYASGITREFTRAPILAGLVLFHMKYKDQAEEFAAMVYSPEAKKSPAARGLYEYLMQGANHKAALVKTDTTVDQTFRVLRIAKYHMDGAERFDHHCLMLPKTAEGMHQLLASFSPAGDPRKLVPSDIDIAGFAALTGTPQHSLVLAAPVAGVPPQKPRRGGAAAPSEA